VRTRPTAPQPALFESPDAWHVYIETDYNRSLERNKLGNINPVILQMANAAWLNGQWCSGGRISAVHIQNRNNQKVAEVGRRPRLCAGTVRGQRMTEQSGFSRNHIPPAQTVGC